MNIDKPVKCMLQVNEYNVYWCMGVNYKCIGMKIMLCTIVRKEWVLMGLNNGDVYIC